MYIINSMEQTLLNISCDVIRQNWNIHKDNITNSPFYDIIWSDWENKYNDFIKNIFYPILKKFILDHNIGHIDNIDLYKYNIIQEKNTLILKGLDKKVRKEVHILCNNMGLYHKSVKITNSKKDLLIYEAPNWLWEYTDPNPHCSIGEYYKKKNQYHEQKRKKQQELLDAEELERTYCDGCGKTAVETQLYCSVYIYDLYCDDCLETLSDGDGEPLGCHKFEPI